MPSKCCSTAVTAVISITNSEHCSKENLCLQGKGPGPHASKLSERNARVMLDFLISISIVYSLLCLFGGVQAELGCVLLFLRPSMAPPPPGDPAGHVRARVEGLGQVSGPDPRG